MIAAVPDRSGGVDNELGGQFESGRDAGFAGFAAVEFTAGFEQFPSCRPVDRSIHATAAQKRTVGGIDNGIHFQFAKKWNLKAFFTCIFRYLKYITREYFFYGNSEDGAV